jgi:hypothetical protein
MKCILYCIAFGFSVLTGLFHTPISVPGIQRQNNGTYQSGWKVEKEFGEAEGDGLFDFYIRYVKKDTLVEYMYLNKGKADLTPGWLSYVKCETGDRITYYYFEHDKKVPGYFPVPTPNYKKLNKNVIVNISLYDSLRIKGYDPKGGKDFDDPKVIRVFLEKNW